MRLRFGRALRVGREVRTRMCSIRETRSLSPLMQNLQYLRIKHMSTRSSICHSDVLFLSSQYWRCRWRGYRVGPHPRCGRPHCPLDHPSPVAQPPENRVREDGRCSSPRGGSPQATRSHRAGGGTWLTGHANLQNVRRRWRFDVRSPLFVVPQLTRRHPRTYTRSAWVVDRCRYRT